MFSKPKKPKLRPKTNIWLDSDGSSIFRKTSASTVNITGDEDINVSTKALTAKARVTTNRFQSRRRNEPDELDGIDPNSSDELDEDLPVTKTPITPITLSNFVPSVPKNNFETEKTDKIKNLLFLANSVGDDDTEMKKYLIEQIQLVLANSNEELTKRLLEIVDQFN